MNVYATTSTLDKTNKIKTAIVIGMLGIICSLTLKSDPVIGTILTGISLVLILFLYGSTPSRLERTDKELRIVCLFNTRIIPLAEIHEVRILEKRDKAGLIRTCGADGIFGYFGLFSSCTISKMMVYARRKDNWTLISTDTGNYVIAPDDINFSYDLMRY